MQSSAHPVCSGTSAVYVRTCVSSAVPVYVYICNFDRRGGMKHIAFLIFAETPLEREYLARNVVFLYGHALRNAVLAASERATSVVRCPSSQTGVATMRRSCVPR